jgi:hypothetical protein
VLLPAPPAQQLGEQPSFGAVPAAGQHTAKVRREFGRDIP